MAEHTPTPYDREIAAELATATSPSGYLEWLRGCREGYRRAKAEDAALLEALQGIQRFSKAYPWTGLGDATSYGDPMKAVRDAIAQATGEEQDA